MNQHGTNMKSTVRKAAQKVSHIFIFIRKKSVGGIGFWACKYNQENYYFYKKNIKTHL